MARDLSLQATLRAPGYPLYTSLGAVEYVWIDITETTGKDISEEPWQIAAGTPLAPGAWIDPDEVVPGTATSSVSLALIVGGTHFAPAKGSYSCWFMTADPEGPEVVIRLVAGGAFSVDGPPLQQVIDNLNGTFTMSGVTDNGDGTLNLSNVTVNGDGTLAIG